MSKDNLKIEASRRKVLRTMGTSGAVATGIAVSSNTVSARSEYESELQKLEQKYDSKQSIQRAIDEHSLATLQLLSKHDIIDKPSSSSLPLGQSINIADVESAQNRDGFAVTSIVEDGEATGFIAISHTTDDRDLSLYVQPEREESYAYVRDDEGTKLFQSKSREDEPSESSEDGTVTTLQDCSEVCYESRCTNRDCYVIWNVGVDYKCCVDENGNEECNRTGSSGCQCGDRKCE
ncbi:hypothetical protein [Natrinema gari]|uniref:hypothetical protein n=1 Tax=Natrinema gari TaxID=419186 RepID=UPI0012689516|nr:hypothetical protein [Natrinema gari]